MFGNERKFKERLGFQSRKWSATKVSWLHLQRLAVGLVLQGAGVSAGLCCFYLFFSRHSDSRVGLIMFKRKRDSYIDNIFGRHKKSICFQTSFL